MNRKFFIKPAFDVKKIAPSLGATEIKRETRGDDAVFSAIYRDN
jgi:hypothetical protein